MIRKIMWYIVSAIFFLLTSCQNNNNSKSDSSNEIVDTAKVTERLTIAVKSNLEKQAQQKNDSVEFEIRELSFRKVNQLFIDSLILKDVQFLHNEYESKSNNSSSKELARKYIDTMMIYSSMDSAIGIKLKLDSKADIFYNTKFKLTAIFKHSSTYTDWGKMILDIKYNAVDVKPYKKIFLPKE